MLSVQLRAWDPAKEGRMQINEHDTAQVGMRDTFPVFGTGRAIESVRLDGIANWRRD